MMRNNFLKKAFSVLLTLTASAVVCAQPSLLKVIPEVQSFAVSSGTFSPPNSITILVKKANSDSLMSVANQLRDELKTMFGTTATVAETSLNTAPDNAILLRISDVKLKNTEAYNMNIAGGITVEGATRVGTFWATRTILQLFENHKTEIPRGAITDYPDYPSRGFMLDTGRKFFTIDFLRHYVKFMSYYKMNELQVHLNDNGFKQYFNNDWLKTYAAFRLESETYPGLAAKDGHYTKAEFRDLQLMGMQYGVNVIPEIDIPAHSLAFTQYNPALAASNTAYGMDHLDLYKPEVYEFFDKLFAEYITGPNPVFVGPDVHIGTDEYNRTESKKFREFTNYYINHIVELGKRPRLWGAMRMMTNDNTPVPAKGGAIINAWSRDWIDPFKSIEDGFKIISTPDAWLYIVPAAGYYRDFLDIQWIFKNYRAEMVNPAESLAPFHPSLYGAMFAVWNDICGNGISQQDVHFRVLPSMQVVGMKLWKSNPTMTYETYSELAKQTSEGPGLNMAGFYSEDEHQAINAKITENAIVFDGTTEFPIGAGDLGYNYDVSFDLKAYAGNATNAVVFGSDFSKLTLNTNGTGKLGFSRDGYTYTFNYVPENKWQNVRIIGDFKSVTLFVDSVRIEKLMPYTKNGFRFQQTLFFPLKNAGDAQNGFKGELKNLKTGRLDMEKLKADFIASKVMPESGNYYIKYGNKYLTNTNYNGSGGNPTFQNMITYSALKPNQHWTITRVSATNRYKIVNTRDGRYLNELVAFGVNPYSDLWNTYNFYKKDSLYAIQNDGNSGKGFWYVENNRLNAGDESYDPENYVVELIPVNATEAETLTKRDLKIRQKKEYVEVTGVTAREMSLYTLSGTVFVTKRDSNILMLNSIPKGMYILHVVTDEDKYGNFKLKF
jgi:hexosaminidase